MGFLKSIKHGFNKATHSISHGFHNATKNVIKPTYKKVLKPAFKPIIKSAKVHADTLQKIETSIGTAAVGLGNTIASPLMPLYLIGGGAVALAILNR
jgi:hypothetical protein